LILTFSTRQISPLLLCWNICYRSEELCVGKGLALTRLYRENSLYTSFPALSHVAQRILFPENYAVMLSNTRERRPG